MLCSYDDIRSRISEAPQWWDEEGVPRYCDMHPDHAANIYAKEVAFVEIACQSCLRRFAVAFSWSDIEWVRDVPQKHEPVTVERIHRLHYGDPPNVGCCPAGATMNCDDVRVLAFWRRGGEEFTEERDGSRVCLPGYFDWRRVPELEIAIDPDFAPPPGAQP